MHQKKTFFTITDIANEGYSIFRVAYMQPTFRETKQVKAYDFNDLVGNVGGYVGMFLGYALLNLSNVLFLIWQTIKDYLMKTKVPINETGMNGEMKVNNSKLSRDLDTCLV